MYVGPVKQRGIYKQERDKSILATLLQALRHLLGHQFMLRSFQINVILASQEIKACFVGGVIHQNLVNIYYDIRKYYINMVTRYIFRQIIFP